ncbi:MAG: hypothetical protein JO362_06175, partial [Streptomycetaceae bacterium]|nr:hypothetical protein [Streptomycetaceae bacterium]
AVAQDFAVVMERYPRLVQVAQAAGLGRVGAYVGVNFARVAGALLTPLRFDDIAALGFRGAWAAVRETASWSKGLEDFRAGWAGYGQLRAAGKGLVAAGVHELALTGSHAGDAGLHELKLAPVVAGMQWHQMLTSLEKLPQDEFAQLFVEASGILQPVMGMPSALVRGMALQGLRAEEFAPLVAVAYTLRTSGEGAAQALAAGLAKELGATPLYGLAGGAPVRETLPGESSGQASGSPLWVPQSQRTGGVPGLEEQGTQAREGQRSSLMTVLLGEPSLLQQKLDQDAALGLMNTTHGLAVPTKAVFTSEAVQKLDQVLDQVGEKRLPMPLHNPGPKTPQLPENNPDPKTPQLPENDPVAGRSTAFARPGAPLHDGTVTDPVTGAVVAETLSIRGKFGKRTGDYWKIDHAAGTAIKVDASGLPRTGRFDTATVKTSPTGQLMLTVPGGRSGDVVLFERELLDEGRMLHLHTDANGRVRWTEIDTSTGRASRHGTRIWNHDLLTYRDIHVSSWLPFYGYEIRHYTKGLDGGLVRAQKHDDGSWAWQRFDKDGEMVLSGTRTWTFSRIGFKDTYLDPLTHKQALAQHYGDTWPLTTFHRSRRYLEHAVIRDKATGALRADPVEYLAQGAAMPKTEWRERLADGATLKVVRLSDTKPPAFFWKGRAGGNPFEKFFSNLFSGDSLFRVHYWTETAANGATLRGVRLLASGGSWRDIDEYGRLVRESRKLDDGRIIEAGRSSEEPDKWAPAPPLPREQHSPYSYQLHWQDTQGEEATGPASSGIRYVTGPTEWTDVFTDSAGEKRIALRAHGTRVRQYLAEFPKKDTPACDPAGVWVEKNHQMQLTGRRDRWGDLYIEAHGSPVRTTWKWRAYTPHDPAHPIAEGLRKQNRGSLFSSTWDDSYTDFIHTPTGTKTPIRERNATDCGNTWINATPQTDGTWQWQRITADGTVHSCGTRTYTNPAQGHWSDTINGKEVRFRKGGPVREFDYTLSTPAPAQPGSLAALLAESTNHFQPADDATVDRRVWKEYDAGQVWRERTLIDPERHRYREIDHQWFQWREYQNDRLVEQRTIDGRIWRTDAYGRRHNANIAKIPTAASLPPMDSTIGLDSHRSWQLIGREVNYIGFAPELRGAWRTMRDVWAD